MKKLFAFAASALLVFASCTNNEFVYENETPQEIGFSPVSKTMTRAAIDGTTFLHSNMVVAAYLADGSTDNGDYFDGTAFSKVGQATNFTGGKYWPIETSTLNFLAVAPEVTNQVTTVFGSDPNDDDDDDNFTNFAGQATVTVANNQTYQHDVMYAIGTGSKTLSTTPDAVSMAFNHALAWINFTFKATSPGITINSVTVNDARYNGTLTVTHTNFNSTSGQSVNASWDNEQATTNAQLVPGQNSVIALPNSAATDATDDDKKAKSWGNGLLVVPCTATSFVVNYTVTIDDVAHTYNHTYSTSLTWAMGKKYVYNITMGLQDIEINPSVIDWNDANADGTVADGEKNEIPVEIN